MSDLDRFELFTTLAQSHSLTEAANNLGISKASLSKSIKRLETDLKVTLFSRAGYRLTLTPQGEMLLAQSVRLKRELDDTRSICQQFHDAPEGELNIVAFGYFAKTLIFPKLDNFLTQYPKLKITINTSEYVPNFEKEHIDIAVGFSLPVPNPDEIVQRSMGTTHYVLCASPAYFQQYGKPTSLDDLKHHHYISHTSRGTEYLKLKPGCQVSIQPHLLVNSVTSLIECAKTDLGLIQLPMYMMKSLLEQNIVQSALDEYQRTDEHIYYHYPKYRYMQPKVQKFIQHFLENL